jgi:SNF2 family DNA or RNA helicase
MRQGFGAVYTKPGSGKTKIMVDLVYNAGYRRVLVIAPKKPCQVWKPEFLKHTPDANLVCEDVSKLSGVKKCEAVTKLTARTNSVQVVVVNYDSVWREPFRSLVLKTKWDAVICDESHRIKTPSSKCSRFLALLHDRVEHRFLLTGTPLHTRPTDIYGQYKFLDKSVFGTRFDVFRDRYENVDVSASKHLGYTVLNRSQPYKNLDELHEKMFSIAYVTEVDLDLPPVQHIEVEYAVNPKTTKYYDAIREEGFLRLEEGSLTIDSILSVQLRQQQLLSGYVPVMNDDGVSKLVKIDNDRIDTLEDLLYNLGDEPVVIFARFKQDFKDIKELFDRMEVSYSFVNGAMDQCEDWKQGRTQYIVVQPQSGSEGLDMTRSRYAIYYSKHPSLGLYNQSLYRLDRPGQERSTTYYHLVGRIKTGKSVDEVILHSHQLNMEIIDYVMQTREL